MYLLNHKDYNEKKTTKIKNSFLFLGCNVFNNNINNEKYKDGVKINNNISKIYKKKQKLKVKKIKLTSSEYYLIQMDANNSKNNEPPNSNNILDNYYYETAIKYDKRHLFRILYICLVSKQRIINLIFFKNPLNLKILQLCLFIFNFSCDLAFNAIFYTNQSISDKYHYEGDNLIYFTFINNSVKTITSSGISIILRILFQYFINSRRQFENIFREEEKKMRKHKKYKVNRATKIIILNKVRKTYIILKYKILIFFITEFFLMLFFYYFVTAFCEVYKMTQLSWLSDFFVSFLISSFYEFILAWTLTLLYLFSKRNKLKFLYTIVLFVYKL